MHRPKTDKLGRGGFYSLVEARPVIEQFHTYRSRDPVAGQERSANGCRHTTHSAATSRADRGSSPLSWATENAYRQQHQQGEVASQRAGYRSESYIAVSRGRREEEEPPPGQYLPAPAVKFNGVHEDSEHPAADNLQCRHDRQPVSPGGDNRPPVSPRDQVPAFLLRASADRHDAHTQPAETGKVYGADDFHGDLRRGNGLVTFVAMLALAVLAVAGTFAYRAMFGGSALSTGSAIVKTGNWANKIAAYGDDQRSDSSQTLVANADRSEKLASLEEQPLDLQDLPKMALRVGSTISISPNSSAPLIDAPGSAAVAPSGPAPATTLAPPEPTAESPPQVAPTGAPGLPQPKKIHTVAIRSKGSDSVGDTPTVPTAEFVSPLAPAPIPAPGSSEPKKVRTIAVRSAGSRPTDPPVSAGISTSARRPSAVAAPPVGPHVSPTPRDSHSRKTVGTGSAALASSHAGYAVQVASESSAADAHTVFGALQTKFPKQLGKREAVVRRSDLGSKGIHYRAMVGPFASMEDATRMCSTLKAAGGNCLVQRN